MFTLETYRSRYIFRLFYYFKHCLARLRSFSSSANSEFRSQQAQTRSTTTAWDREEANRQAERILDTYGNSILRLAYSYVRHLTDAEDLLQEVLIRYLRSAPSFESTEHEKAWLLRVTINLSKNKIKFNQTRRTLELADNDVYTEAEADLKVVRETVNGNEEFASRNELSAHIGFEVKEITELPFTSIETLYVSIAGEIAEIQYTAGKQTIDLRMSRGSGDNSGDYESYPTIAQIQSSGRNVTIKGDADGFKLVLWEEDGFTYSIRSNEGLSEKQMSEIASSVR